MQGLDAALAFGITMLVLAMVVTTIVETLHRLFGLREKGLALLLGNFYDRVMSSRTGDAPGGTQQRDWFIDLMTVNRGPVGRAPITALGRALHIDARSEDRKFLNWIWSGRRLGSLSLTAFMERLGGSEYGARLMSEVSGGGDKAVEWTLKDIAQKFDAFGLEASEYFESRARLLSVIVGFVLAFAINVNALVLFDTFMHRPDVTQAVIAQGERVTAAYEKLEKETTAVVPPAAAAPPAGAPAAPPPTPDEAARQQQQIADLRTSVQTATAEAKTAVATLKTAGVPVGWTPQAWTDFTAAPWTTLLGLLLGGLLIGLGAPFWYRMVQTLTGLRGGAREDKDKAAPAAAATPAPPAGPNQLPSTPIDAFHVALGSALAAGQLQPTEEAVG
jgi:hypothetical protein